MLGRGFLSVCKRCLGWAALVSVFAGGYMVRMGSERSAAADGAKAEPREAFFGPLAVRGPGNNTHVKIKQFSLGHAYVYESDSNDNWKQVWIPMFPAGAIPRQHPVQVILRSTNVRNGADIETLARRPFLTGMMSKSAKIIGPKSQANLALDYSGTDFSKVRIFEEGMEAPSRESARSLLFSGIGLCIFGVLGALVWYFYS